MSLDNPEGESTKKSSWTCILLAVLLLLMANSLFVANNYGVKTFDIRPAEYIFLRAPLQVIVCSSISLCQGHKLIPTGASLRFWVCLLSTLWAACVFFATAGVSMLPINDFVVLVYTNPICTLVLSALLVKKFPSLIEVFLVLGLLLGITLIMQPCFLFRGEQQQDATFPYYKLGVGLSLACALCAGSAYALIVKCENVPSMILNMYTGLCSGILTLVLPFLGFENRILSDPGSINLQTWLAMLLLNCIMLAAMQLIFIANKMASPTLTATLRSLEIVITMLVEIVAFAHIPNGLKIVGTVIVVVSISLLPLSERMSDQCNVVRENIQSNRKLSTKDEKNRDIYV